jgi:hypothetical protein
LNPILAEKLSRIGDWGGSNLDANSLQSGSVLDAIQHHEFCVHLIPLPHAHDHPLPTQDFSKRIDKLTNCWQ